VVGEFGEEFATGANLGQTSRELRVWPQQKLLMVMYFRCSAVIHACPPSADTWRIRFFDLTDPVHPTLVATYVPSRKPHEMYLWLDPQDPGRPFAITIDEVYGTFTVSSFGWPWGWMRTWNVAQPRRPRMLAEYKILQNTIDYTPAPGENELTSYSSHNPTPTRNLVIDAWHSGGLQAIDVSSPRRPVQAGWFSPTPLGAVANEDPALSRGPNKVVTWSFPIIRHGLVYVVDIRNGLYVLRYTGPHAKEVKRIRFLEGNSNLGDALRLAHGRDR